jgi:hypothetical protein
MAVLRPIQHVLPVLISRIKSTVARLFVAPLPVLNQQSFDKTHRAYSEDLFPLPPHVLIFEKLKAGRGLSRGFYCRNVDSSEAIGT